MATFFIKISVFLFKKIPFRGLYALSDFLYFLFTKIIKYRKKVIVENLQNSFPEKKSVEIATLVAGAYRNLCDVTLEGFKGLTMSAAELRQRYIITNAEVLDEHFNNGQSVILTGGHYTNWEWGVIGWSLWFKHKVIGIYKPLTNKKVESFLNKKRETYGMVLAATYETRAALEQHQNEPCLYVLMGDQSPSNLRSAHWLTFLNQDTAWLHGVGTIAHHQNFPIYYLDTQRIRRGFYESRLILLVENPKDISPKDISNLYAAQLEKIILQKPEDWLWSHKRWKHKR